MQHDVELRCHPMAAAPAHPGLAHSAMAASHDALDTMGHIVYKVSLLYLM